MIQWVYEAASESNSLSHLVVATDDERIAKAVKDFGGSVELTSADHETGTDRVAEVSERYPELDVVANIQGDQPFVTASIIDRLVSPYMSGDRPSMTTVACRMNLEKLHDDPNAVKVICDRKMDSIYFSRAPIPFFRNSVQAPVFHHLGLYAFTRAFLRDYSTMEQTPLETCEALEQLRVIEHGHRIRVTLIDSAIAEVNTPEDLVAANEQKSTTGL